MSSPANCEDKVTGSEVEPTSNPSNTPKRTFEVVEISEPSGERDANSGAAVQNGGDFAPSQKGIGGGGRGISLYEDDAEQRPYVSSILASLIDYSCSVQNSNITKRKPTDTLTLNGGGANGKDPASTGKTPAAAAQAKKPQLGTVVGVYLPTMQNIFGVLLFLRLAWMVGTAGVIHAFCIVFLCCSCTMLTAISMSAIATNGYVPAGGSYFMISRALGPECGGAVGVLFFIGTSFAAAMYIIGAVEILLTYISQDISLFGPIGNSVEGVSQAMLNNMRVYGTLFLIAMSTLVFVGVKYVNKLAALFLACVIISISCIYIGFFTTKNVEPKICVVTANLPSRDVPIETLISLTGKFAEYDCSFDDSLERSQKNLYDMYCTSDGFNRSVHVCHEEFPFLDGQVQLKYGIPGLMSGELFNNLNSFYRIQGEVVPGIREKISAETASVKADITTSMMILTGIFFPSCTGIMAGSNRSGDLANAAASIPVGTIGAILTTSTVYLSFVLLFGSVASGPLLRDKYGVSVGGELLCAMLAFPSKYVVLFGAFFSTVGAGLQSLTGAPRLLQAIARDDILPPLKYFAKGKKNGEPSWALLLSAAIAEVGILIASVDSVAPIITIFFLICYLFVNLACAVQTLLKSPNWRPKFRFYHWGLSLLGMAICLFIMFISNWWQALIAMLIALGIYKYIEYAGAKKEWGDGIRGLSLSAALYGLRRLEDSEVHTKNWRPQILALITENDNMSVESIEAKFAFPFVSQLKAGKGLTIIGSILRGGSLSAENMQQKDLLYDTLSMCMLRNKVKGFTQVSISDSLHTGYMNLIQLSGLGGLKPNTILMNWPREVINENAPGNTVEFSREAVLFYDVLHGVASGKQHVFIAVRNSEMFPSNKEIQPSAGTIDIWWIVHDGGILMLLGFLLRQHKVWRHTTMRIFTVAQPEDNSIKIKKDLEQFLNLLRIEATVDVIEMPSDDISAYTYEKTLIMEQRNKLLQNLQMTRRESRREVQVLTDSRRHKFSLATNPLLQTAGFIPEEEPLPETGKRGMLKFNMGGSGEGGATSTVPEIRIDTQETQNNSESVVDSPPAEHHVNNEDPPPTSESLPPTDGNDVIADPAGVALPRIGSFSMQAVIAHDKDSLKPDDRNVKAMDAAEKLNSVVVEKSFECKLLFINLPAPPSSKSPQKFYNYFHFVESLTKDLKMPIVLVRGSGREFVTIYS